MLRTLLDQRLVSFAADPPAALKLVASASRRAARSSTRGARGVDHGGEHDPESR